MDSPPLYILRHGETEWNASGRLQGRFDSPLTEKGRAQAAVQRMILNDIDLAGYSAFSSPQGRAFQTAAMALEGLVEDIRTDDRLSEIGLGDWAGEDRARLMAARRISNSFALYELAPGGEGFVNLHARCSSFLASLEAPAVLVTHGITSRMLRLILLGRGISDLHRIDGGQGVVFKLENGKQTRLIKRA